VNAEAWDIRQRDALQPWYKNVVEVWNEHWKGTDHRYGKDCAAFVGERLMTDFYLRPPQPPDIYIKLGIGP